MASWFERPRRGCPALVSAIWASTASPGAVPGAVSGGDVAAAGRAIAEVAATMVRPISGTVAIGGQEVHGCSFVGCGVRLDGRPGACSTLHPRRMQPVDRTLAVDGLYTAARTLAATHHDLPLTVARQPGRRRIMRYKALGPLEFERDGVPVPIRGPQLRRLFAVLVSHRGRQVSGDRLVDALWPDGGRPTAPPGRCARTCRASAARCSRRRSPVGGPATRST